MNKCNKSVLIKSCRYKGGTWIGLCVKIYIAKKKTRVQLSERLYPAEEKLHV